MKNTAFEIEIRVVAMYSTGFTKYYTIDTCNNPDIWVV